MDKYQIEAEKLVRAIDIKMEAVQKYIPKGFTQKHIDLIVKSCLQDKELALDKNKKFRNMASLNSLKNDVLTIFQEDSGEHVEFFWKKVEEYGLGYKRVDMLAKILKRKRISTLPEYDYAIDTIVPAQQEGRISEEEAKRLGKYITQYQNKAKSSK